MNSIFSFEFEIWSKSIKTETNFVNFVCVCVCVCMCVCVCVCVCVYIL